MTDMHDQVEELKAIFERYPRFLQAMLDGGHEWQEDGRLRVRFVGPDHPELWAGVAAVCELFGIDREDHAPTLPPTGHQAGW